jgi:hypothetical protein
MTAEQLMRLTVKDLRALAERQGVTGHARLRKDQLIGALLPLVTSKAPAPAPQLTSSPTGSSTSAPVASAPAPQRGPDPGLPIPESYGRDRLVLLIQDPHHIFAYWEVSPGTYARVAALAGAGSAQVLILHTPSGPEQREIDLRGGNYYLSVAPGSTYRAEIALRGKDGKLHQLAVSNFVQTPAAGPSARTDATWMEVDETFHELLALAGLPGQDPVGSLARLQARTLDARVLGEHAVAARGLSSVSLSRQAKAHLEEAMSSAAVSSTALSSTALSSTALSSTALSSTALSKRPVG